MRTLGPRILVLVLAAVLTPCAVADEEGPPRPAVPDAARTMEEILGALESLPVRILKMDVKERSARLRVEADDAAACDSVREALAANVWLQGLARISDRVVEVGALRTADRKTHGDFDLRFANDGGPPAPEHHAAHIPAKLMLELAGEAGLRQIYASREREVPNRAAGHRLIGQMFEYQAADGRPVGLTLTKLRNLCTLVSETQTYRVTQVAWTRALPKDALLADCIKKPRIEVTAWQPLQPAARDAGSAPGALAEAILRGPDRNLVGAAQRLEGLSADARLQLLLELREQARIHAILEHVQVEDLVLEGANLDDALKQVLGPLGVAWRLSAKLRAETYDEVQVTLHLDSVTVGTVLALLTEPYEIRMFVRAGGIQLVTSQEEHGLLPDPKIGLLAKLFTTKITLKLDQVPFKTVVEYVRSMTGFNLHIDPRIEGDLAQKPVAATYVEDVPVMQVLDMLADAAGDDVVWTVKGNVVVFTKRSLLGK